MSTRIKVTDIFSREEITMLTKRSDLMGAWAVGSTWLVIALCFAGLAWASTSLPWWGVVIAFMLTLLIVAGRQLALAILMHDASHSTLFASKWANDVLADWLCARPIWNDLHQYRPYHVVHHAKTSSDDDPDLSLTAGLPTTRRSLMRKFLRDLVGLTGLKFFLGRVMMDAGIIKWTTVNDVQYLPQDGRRWWDYPRSFIKNSAGMLITNSVLLAIFALSGHAWLYGVWVLAYVTPFPLLLRIRSMAEHACTEKSVNMFKNTRSTRAGLMARALVAPIRVNYHIEHHVMLSVPFFKLPLMHKMLRERSLVNEPPSYWQVLQQVSTPLASNKP